MVEASEAGVVETSSKETAPSYIQYPSKEGDSHLQVAFSLLLNAGNVVRLVADKELADLRGKKKWSDEDFERVDRLYNSLQKVVNKAATLRDAVNAGYKVEDLEEITIDSQNLDLDDVDEQINKAVKSRDELPGLIEEIPALIDDTRKQYEVDWPDENQTVQLPGVSDSVWKSASHLIGMFIHEQQNMTSLMEMGLALKSEGTILDALEGLIEAAQRGAERFVGREEVREMALAEVGELIAEKIRTDKIDLLLGRYQSRITRYQLIVEEMPEEKVRMSRGTLEEVVGNTLRNSARHFAKMINSEESAEEEFIFLVRSKIHKINDQELVDITYVDNGPGYPPKLLGGFKPGLTTSEEEGGTGWGMWSAMGLVREEGGDLFPAEREDKKRGAVTVMRSPVVKSISGVE